MRSIVLSLSFVLLVCSIGSGHGQVATGIYPFGTFDNHGFDSTNTGNLNTHFAIPVINKPGRGMPFYYNLSYDSQIWTPVSGGAWTLAQGAGWRGVSEIATGYMSVSINTSTGRVRGSGGLYYTCPVTTYSGFVYHDPFGVQHAFSGVTRNTSLAPEICGEPPSTTSFTATATDGSGYQISVTDYDNSVLTAKNGNVFTPPLNSGTGSGTVVDSNGNEISTDGAGNFTDTLGKTVLAVTGSSASSQYFTYTDTHGNPQSVTANYSTYTVQTNFGCPGISEYGPTSTQLISSITMPDSSSYSFTYEATPGYSGSVTGRLASVTLPTGGKITYTYTGGSNGIVCADGSASGLTRVMSNDPAGSTWTYTRSASTSTSQTQAIDGLGNYTEYDFVGSGSAWYETQRQVYNGAATGTPVLSKMTCYNGVLPSSSPSCPTAPLTLPISEVDTYNTLDGSVQNGSTIIYDAYGDLIQEIDYDYGTATSRGSTLLNTQYYGYATQAIVGEFTNVTVEDASNHLIGQTIYYYDQTAPTATSGLPQHVAVPGARGQLNKAVSTVNSYTTVTSSYTYNDAGQMLTSVDPEGNTTSYTYDSTYDAYLTGTTFPTVGGVTLLIRPIIYETISG